MRASARRCSPDFKPKVSSPLVRYVYTAADLLGYNFSRDDEECQIDPALLEYRQQEAVFVEEMEIVHDKHGGQEKGTALWQVNESRIEEEGYSYVGEGEGVPVRQRSTCTSLKDDSMKWVPPVEEAALKSSEPPPAQIVTSTPTANPRSSSVDGPVCPALEVQAVQAINLPLQGRKRSYSDGDEDGRVAKHRKGYDEAFIVTELQRWMP